MKVRNDFQFLEVDRHNPDVKPMDYRHQEFGEIYRSIPNRLAEQQAGRCIDCAIPYCEVKCPVHNYIPNWLQLLAENRIFEAAELCHRTNSLPEVCGRVCPQDRLCEGACTLNTGFGAVTIGAAEKYIVDTALAMGWEPPLPKNLDSGKKVAIVGSGPAAIGCADVLRQHGVGVVVHERNAEIGGLLTFGIPEFKLEKRIVARRRGLLERMGIEFRTNVNVGTDLAAADLLQEYDCLFLGMGTYTARTGNLPGHDSLKGVYPALDYLSAQTAQYQNYQYPADFVSLQGKRVLVLGGGDTGMDCNRTAIRQGARSVHCIYRRDEQNMPGSRREVEHSHEEGVTFLFQLQPLEIVGDANDKVIGVKVIETKASDSVGDSRMRFEPVPGTERIIEADAVLMSFGFDCEPFDWLREINVQVDNKGLVVVPQTPGANPDIGLTRSSFQTSNPKVFAGGDVVWGADLVVTAVDAGRRAALSILKELNIDA